MMTPITIITIIVVIIIAQMMTRAIAQNMGDIVAENISFVVACFVMALFEEQTKHRCMSSSWSYGQNED